LEALNFHQSPSPGPRTQQGSQRPQARGIARVQAKKKRNLPKPLSARCSAPLRIKGDHLHRRNPTRPRSLIQYAPACPTICGFSGPCSSRSNLNGIVDLDPGSTPSISAARRRRSERPGITPAADPSPPRLPCGTGAPRANTRMRGSEPPCSHDGRVTKTRAVSPGRRPPGCNGRGGSAVPPPRPRTVGPEPPRPR